MFQNILVPLDGSFVGETALPYASALAARTGASLTLVRATHMPVGVGDRSSEYQRVIAEAEAYLSTQAAAVVARGFVVQTGVPFGGSPAAWIAEEVGMRKADLIVMATHDRSGPNRWLHGSVAEAVVAQAGVPVLLVRATEGVRRIERLDAPRPELIVPLDGSSLAEAAVPLGRGLAKALGGHIVLVGVIPTPGQLVAEQGGAIGTYVGSDHARLESEAKAYLEAILGSLTASGLSAEATVRQGKPAVEIGEVAREHGAAAVVMATHGRTGLVRTLLGSVAGEVLHLGASPVILVRPPEPRPAEEPIRDSATSAALAPG
ncbi:MAG TPA: universal stress protein [Chloroflexota bacterium]|nr:universal stress protein [Chloroflexota bacterium]